MKAERFTEILGEIDEQYLRETDELRQKLTEEKKILPFPVRLGAGANRKTRIRRFAAMAACLAVLLIAGNAIRLGGQKASSSASYEAYSTSDSAEESGVYEYDAAAAEDEESAEAMDSASVTMEESADKENGYSGSISEQAKDAVALEDAAEINLEVIAVYEDYLEAYVAESDSEGLFQNGTEITVYFTASELQGEIPEAGDQITASFMEYGEDWITMENFTCND